MALSGHGVQVEVEDPDEKKPPKTYSFFCPSDADLLKISYSTGKSKTLVNVNELFGALENCGGGVKLALMDACRNEMKADSATRSLDVRRVTIPEGVAVMFSCKSGEKAFETKTYENGVFFHFVLEGLGGKAANERKEVTWRRLVEYVTEQVTDNVPTVIGDGAKQTPHPIDNLPGKSPVLVIVKKSEDKAEGKPKDKNDKVAKGSKKYALLVGVTEYESKGISGLWYAGNDAEKLGKVLSEKAKFDEVMILTSVRGKNDKTLNPTAENIRVQMKKLVEKKAKDDLILVALAGQGVTAQVADPKGKAKAKEFLMFCPSDADLTEAIEFNSGKAKTLVNIDTDVFDPLGNSGAGLKVFLIDTDRSEKEFKGRNQGDTPKTASTIPEGVVGMFSCVKGQFCFETKELEHGIFSHYVIKGIEGEAADKDGVITWSQLSGYVRENVEKYVKDKIGQGARQTPYAVANLKGSSTLFKIR